MNRIILFFAGLFLLLGFNESFGQKGKTPRKSKSVVISCGVCNQKAIFLPKPEYPETARAIRASGSVGVEILIDEKGSVIKARAVSGHPLLLASAVRAAYLAKFEPFLLGGKPVRVSGRIVYNYLGDSSNQSNPKKFTVNAIELHKPPFPSLCNARFSKNENVTVEAEIDEKGNVTSATTISGHPCLKVAAVQAARFSKFEPPKVIGAPVRAKTRIFYTFILESKISISVLVIWVKPIEK